MNLLLDVPNDIMGEYFYWIEMVDMIPLSVTNKYLYNQCNQYDYFIYFLKNIQKIGCGEYYTTIIKNNNLYFFGFNIKRLDATISTPKKINKHCKTISVCCGADYAIITNTLGTYSIGNYDSIQLYYNIKNIIAVYSGSNFILIYTKNHLYSMGCNDMGQLGLGYLCKSVTKPTIISFFDHHKIKSISVGDDHSIIMTDRGTYVFGANKHHQLGLDSDYHCITTPHPLTISGIISTNCGGHHSFLLAQDGLYGCGSNIHGELGLSEQKYYRTFTKISINNIINDINQKDVKNGGNNIIKDNINDIIFISCGFNFTFIMTTNNIITFGDNYYGQLSIGKFSLKSIHAIECGYNHTLIKVNDNYYGVGGNKYNQLGLGNFKNKKYKVPKLIRVP
jgi:alpha-tubulin suppressor-like RCC1 family protein